MKKSVRLLSILLAVVIAFGMFAIAVSAEGEVANVTIKTNVDTVVAGDIIEVTVNVANNYYATAMRWPVLFSNAFFELVEGSVKATDELNALGGSAICNEKPDNTVYTTTYSSTDYTGVLVQWTAAVSATGVTPYNQEDGMDCFTFQLKVKEDINVGDAGVIVIPEDYPRFYNYILTDMEEPFSPDKVVKCETLVHTFAGATVECVTPEILPVEDSGVVLDKTKKYIKGIAIGTVDNLDSYVYPSVGEIVIVTVKENRMGTGSKVSLAHNGITYETYTLIIAGDINGDAYVDYMDLMLLDWYEAYGVSFSGVQKVAADLNGDGKVDANDKIALDAYLNFEYEIDQATGTVVSL
ncbi:MAG: hypothetical protein E7536_07645 [Ruminococcaceae bacterium]|nr:hypothetical protein [Oscillospiraceae bacterium]